MVSRASTPKRKNLKSYFEPLEARGPQLRSEEEEGESKMATRQSQLNKETSISITKTELKELFANHFADLRAELKADMSALLSPIKKSIQQLNERVTTLENSAEQAADFQIKTARRIQKLQETNQQLKDKLDYTENYGKRCNLRFRGFKEGIERDITIVDFMAKWIKESFELDFPEEGGWIVNAYRVNPYVKVPTGSPRDIIVKFLNFKDKDLILKKSRSKATITHEKQSILIFQDLSAETLQRKKQLRPITAALKEAGLKYHWGFPFKLRVSFEDKLLSARNFKEAKALLNTVGITLNQQLQRKIDQMDPLVCSAEESEEQEPSWKVAKKKQKNRHQKRTQRSALQESEAEDSND